LGLKSATLRLGERSTRLNSGPLLRAASWRHFLELLAAATPVYSEWKNLLVWNKEDAGQGTMTTGPSTTIRSVPPGSLITWMLISCTVFRDRLEYPAPRRKV